MLRKKVCAALVSVAVLLIMVSVEGGASAAAPAGIGYTHGTLGFSVTLPSGWEGRYLVEEHQKGAWFASIRNEAAGYGGLLFGIELFDHKPELPTENYELARVGGNYYYVSFPGDISWAYEDPALTKEYHDMRKDIEGILKTFRYKAQ